MIYFVKTFLLFNCFYTLIITIFKTPIKKFLTSFFGGMFRFDKM